MATLAILLVLGQWNDIIWASVVINDEELYTVSLGVWSMVRAYTEQTQWGLVFAGFTVTSLPIIILFIFTRNLFIKGLSSGALKV
jgi:ABC-type glycerol-3-phosphate transport system permease component